MKDNNFWICGKHTVLEALKNPERKVIQIALGKKSKIPIANFNLKKTNISYEDISFFNKKFGSSFPHQSIAAKIEATNRLNIKDIPNIEKIESFLVLDGVNDPRNIGAIIRSAVAYGWKHIIVNANDFNFNSYVMYKTASGSMEHVKIYLVSNVFNDIKYLKKNNFWIIGMSVKGDKSLYDYKYLKNIALIFGSEKKGIKNYLERFCDETFYLPISNKIESLNVSTATSATFSVLDYLKKKPANN